MENRINYPNKTTEKYLQFLIGLRKEIIGIGFKNIKLSQYLMVYGISKAVSRKMLSSYIEMDNNYFIRWKGEYMPTIADAIKIHKKVNESMTKKVLAWREKHGIKSGYYKKTKPPLITKNPIEFINIPATYKKKEINHTQEKAGIFIRLWRFLFYNPYK